MVLGKTLLTGWFSFLHGEATAGDVLALRRVSAVLERVGTPYDTAWSPHFQSAALHLDDADPRCYDRLVFVCGPLHGPRIAELHERFARCTRIAVGVSVLDPQDPAARGFHQILARDGAGLQPATDLAAAAPSTAVPPVVAVVLTHGQREYGSLRRHQEVSTAVTAWLADQDCARLELDTRLAVGDWRRCATPEQFHAVLSRTDLVVTNRLHGLVLALRCGVPVLAIDPVHGGAKVSAQAEACRWPALLPAEDVRPERLAAWWTWCLTSGRALARHRRRELGDLPVGRAGSAALVAALNAAATDEPPPGAPSAPG